MSYFLAQHNVIVCSRGYPWGGSEGGEGGEWNH